MCSKPKPTKKKTLPRSIKNCLKMHSPQWNQAAWMPDSPLREIEGVETPPPDAEVERNLSDQIEQTGGIRKTLTISSGCVHQLDLFKTRLPLKYYCPYPPFPESMEPPTWWINSARKEKALHGGGWIRGHCRYCKPWKIYWRKYLVISRTNMTPKNL